MKTIENEIREAIDRSISHTECVSITVEATICEVIAAIESVTVDTEVDYVKNGDIYDVWGWTEATASNEQDWRLNVTIVVNLESLAEKLGYESIEWDPENDCYSGSGSSDPVDRSKDDGKFHVAINDEELAEIWKRS